MRRSHPALNAFTCWSLQCALGLRRKESEENREIIIKEGRVMGVCLTFQYYWKFKRKQSF